MTIASLTMQIASIRRASRRFRIPATVRPALLGRLAARDALRIAVDMGVEETHPCVQAAARQAMANAAEG